VREGEKDSRGEERHGVSSSCGRSCTLLICYKKTRTRPIPVFEVVLAAEIAA
jgi:hypothetical protein